MTATTSDKTDANPSCDDPLVHCHFSSNGSLKTIIIINRFALVRQRHEHRAQRETDIELNSRE